MQFPALSMFQSSLSFLLECTGRIPAPPSNQHYPTNHNLIANRTYTQTQLPNSTANHGTSNNSSTGEVSIQIVETEESVQLRQGRNEQDGGTLSSEADANNGDATVEGIALVSSAALSPRSHSDRGRLVGDDAWGRQGSSSHGIEILPIVRWIDQILPFLLLLVIVFIRQHLQGFVVASGITGVLFKSNNILRRQTALKGERKILVLALISIVAMLYVVGLYCWYRNDDLLPPLIMLPPKVIPQFWHAVFIVIVNVILYFINFIGIAIVVLQLCKRKTNHLVLVTGIMVLLYATLSIVCSSFGSLCPSTLVRQAAKAFKCLLLMYYKNSSNPNYRWQGQMLTLVEYMLLLYRALVPITVWLNPSLQP